MILFVSDFDGFFSSDFDKLVERGVAELDYSSVKFILLRFSSK